MTQKIGQIKYFSAVISGASGDITVVTAVANHRINVHGFVVSQDTANSTIRFESEAGGTALTGAMETSIDTPVVVPFSEVPWFTTDAEAVSTDDDLSLESGGAAAHGFLIYSLVKIR